MALTSVYLSIAPLEEQLQVKTYPAKDWNGTEYEKGEPVTGSMMLAPLPLTPRDLKNLDSGEFSLEDMKFYQMANAALLAVNDQIERRGVWYTIRKPPLDRSTDGGYRVYFAKRQLAGPS